MKRQKLQSLTMSIGSLLVIAIVWSQLFHFHSTSFYKDEVKTEQQESDRNPDDSIISLSSFSLPSPVHVLLNLDAHCLFEILFEDQGHSSARADAPQFPKKLLITLFRVIISPNAP